MEISSSNLKRCNLIKINGRLDSSTSPQLEKSLKESTDAGNYKIVLDISEVSFLSSAALRVLINYQKMCRRYNRGEIVLASAPSNIYRALDLAGFTTLFKIYDDAVTAVGNF